MNTFEGRHIQYTCSLGVLQGRIVNTFDICQDPVCSPLARRIPYCTHEFSLMVRTRGHKGKQDRPSPYQPNPSNPSRTRTSNPHGRPGGAEVALKLAMNSAAPRS